MYQEGKKMNKGQINENASSVLYHFTSNFRGIMNQNCFYFRMNDTFDYKQPEGYDYYLSATRSKNDNEGFSLKYSTQEYTEGHVESYARLTLNGNLINMNNKLKAEPFNFFYSKELNEPGTPSPKQHYHNFLQNPEASKSDGYPTKGYGIYDMDFDEVNGELVEPEMEPDQTPEAAAFRVQSEDRIFSKTDTLPNAFKYIMRIDIYAGTSSLVTVIQSLNMVNNIQAWAPKVFIYKDRNEFNKQSDKCFKLTRMFENKVRFGMNDIKYMVNEVIKRIRK